MAIMRSETFILVDGPAVVSNAQLGAAIAAHTARNRADTNAIMTLLMKRLPAEPAAASAVRGDARSLTRVVLNPVDGKLHAYVSDGPRGAGPCVSAPRTRTAAGHSPYPLKRHPRTSSPLALHSPLARRTC
jgi:hypothetical protein